MRVSGRTEVAIPGVHTVEIEAPDGRSALALDRRLRRLGSTTMWRQDRWTIEVAGIHDVSRVETEVRDWLRRTGSPTARLRVDGQPKTLTAAPPSRHRGSHGDFIG